LFEEIFTTVFGRRGGLRFIEVSWASRMGAGFGNRCVTVAGTCGGLVVLQEVMPPVRIKTQARKQIPLNRKARSKILRELFLKNWKLNISSLELRVGMSICAA
jgi:hypothetical protein